MNFRSFRTYLISSRFFRSCIWFSSTMDRTLIESIAAVTRNNWKIQNQVEFLLWQLAFQVTVYVEITRGQVGLFTNFSNSYFADSRYQWHILKIKTNCLVNILQLVIHHLPILIQKIGFFLKNILTSFWRSILWFRHALENHEASSVNCGFRALFGPESVWLQEDQLSATATTHIRWVFGEFHTGSHRKRMFFMVRMLFNPNLMLF